MYVTRDGVETPGWISTLETENPVDFEMGNFFTAMHPESLFRTRIIASAVTSDGRVNIMNRDVTVLAGDEAATAVRPQKLSLERIVLTRDQMRNIFILVELILPLSLVLMGGLVWWRRR